MSTNRNHEYIYTVGVRTVSQIDILDKHGKPTGETEEGTSWPLHEVIGCNIHEVAGKLHLKLGDIRYLHKEILK